MKKKEKKAKVPFSVFKILFIIALSSIAIFGWFIVHKKTVMVENNFNSYLNTEIVPIHINFDKNNTNVVPSLGIIAKKGVSCISYPTLNLEVVTNCTLENGEFSILNFEKKKKVYIPIFKFKEVLATIKTPLFSQDLFKRFDINFNVLNMEFSDKILNYYITRNSDKIEGMLLGDIEELNDYNTSKKELFDTFKGMNFYLSLEGRSISKKRFDIYYELKFEKPNKIIYENSAKFSMVAQKEEDVSIEFNDASSAFFGGIKRGSYKSSPIDFLSYSDKSYLAFENPDYIKNLIYDFYKINYYGAENKILHNYFYLNEQNDVMFSKEEVLNKINPLLDIMYQRVKGNPLGLLVRGIISAEKDKSGVYIVKKLKMNKKPMSLITEGVRVNFNFDKYYKEIIDRYTLKAEDCNSIEDCRKRYGEY